MHDSEIHLLPCGVLPWTRELLDTPKTAKFLPVSVKEVDPDLGALEFNDDMIGESNETAIVIFDLSLSTAQDTTASNERPAPCATLPLKLESDTHVETEETLRPKTSFMLTLKEPMLAPIAVTELHPVAATKCASIEDSDGTLKESAFETLP